MKNETQLAKFKRINRAQRLENAELKETLTAIRNGEVDALVISSSEGERIFTLQSTEQPYRELVEAMNEGALTLSREGIILYCNARFEAMTRVRHGKLVGSNLREHIRPESRLAVQALLERSRTSPSSAEISLIVTEHISLPVQLSVSAIRVLGSKGYCIIATDLSAQKQTAILFQQQEWLGSLLSLLPVPLVLLEPDLQNFTFINAKATEVLMGSLRGDERPPLPPTRLVFENVRGEVLEIHELLAQMGSVGKVLGVEAILATRARKIPVLLFSETLPAMYGRDPVRLLMFQDISMLKQALRDLSLALRGRDQFMAALSHELRTPINVILGWVQLLRSHPADPELFEQAVDTLNRNAELQRDLIENLLDMSRIVTGSLVLERKPLDLKISVRDCLTSLQPKAEEKEIDVQLDVVGDRAVVMADDQRIQQLIFNLVQNAIKFTPAKGKIVVRIRSDRNSHTASLSVEDNGQGIDAAFLPYVFDQFKQANMSTNRAFGGLGLGLTICKAIVAQHLGVLEARSDGLGKGAAFLVRLPLYTVGENVVLGAAAKVQVVHLEGLRVLLVDDSLDNLALFSIWLKKSGAEIKTVESAAGVLELLESFKPHVLLSDISMPGEDGYSLIAKIRALPASRGGQVPAGALTANARLEDRELTLAAGFQTHIPKPVTHGDLVAAVKFLADIGRGENLSFL